MALNTSIRGEQIKANEIDENHLTASVAGTGIAGGNGSALSVDLDEVAEVAVDVANDYIAFMDANDNGDTKKESIADLVTAMAGVGLSASSGVLALDLNEVTAEVIAVSEDLIVFEDATDGGTQKESIADLMTAVAGDALGASAGVLAVQVDDSTIEIASDSVRVKDSGVTNAKLAGSIATSKLLLKSVWKELSPDGSTAQFDLDEALSSNLTNIQVFRNGLCVKQVSSSPADEDQYTVSATGGAGGVGRVTFGANIASTDDLRVFYIA